MLFGFTNLKVQRFAIIGIFLLFFATTFANIQESQPAPITTPLPETKDTTIKEQVLSKSTPTETKATNQATSSITNDTLIENIQTEPETTIVAVEEKPKTITEVTTETKKVTEKSNVTTPSKTDLFSSAFIREHNKIRQAHNLNDLSWSSKLAASAQAWSEVLKGEGCKMRHDLDSPYGENIYWQQQNGGEISALISQPADAVFYWGDEEKYYNYSKNTCRSGEQCGHYTQVVWADTTSVGCGVSSCLSGDTRTDVWVCRYNPAGNITGVKPY